MLDTYLSAMAVSPSPTVFLEIIPLYFGLPSHRIAWDGTTFWRVVSLLLLLTINIVISVTLINFSLRNLGEWALFHIFSNYHIANGSIGMLSFIMFLITTHLPTIVQFLVVYHLSSGLIHPLFSHNTVISSRKTSVPLALVLL